MRFTPRVPESEMRATLCLLPVLLFGSVVAEPAGAGVTVAFVAPESYADMGQFGGEAESAMREIGTHLARLGERYLPPGQELRVEILDIDLAGHRPLSARMDSGTRILDGRTDWPRIRLHYVRQAGARVLDDRVENISDMGYLQHSRNKYSAQPYPYEKQMLEDWFKLRFAEGKRPGN